MRLNSKTVIAEERRNSVSGEIANRKDDVSLEVRGIPGGAQDQSSMEKAQLRDEQFQVLMRTFESLDPARPNPWTSGSTGNMCSLCFQSVGIGFR